jgi:hypothetical protein
VSFSLEAAAACKLVYQEFQSVDSLNGFLICLFTVLRQTCMAENTCCVFTLKGRGAECVVKRTL